jgi:type II secretory pathway pseudopilin PulG
MVTVPDRRSIVERNRGFSLLELGLVLLLLVVILVPAAKFSADSSSAFSSLSAAMHETSRALVVLDRINSELITGNFTTVAPAVPTADQAIEFQKIIDVQNGAPVFGNPIHIDLVPMETNIDDGIDNDGDGLVDEQGVRIWEDRAPASVTPQVEDAASVICANVAKGGLLFNRQGAILFVDMTFQDTSTDSPTTFTLRTGVKMRNNL